VKRGINVVVIQGNVGPEDSIQYTTNKKNREACVFALANDDRGGFTTWVRVNVGGGLVPICRDYLTTGRRIVVKGSLINRSGGAVEVLAEELIFE
jgi:single-stranded DNA-binding protein